MVLDLQRGARANSDSIVRANSDPRACASPPAISHIQASKMQGNLKSSGLLSVKMEEKKIGLKAQTGKQRKQTLMIFCAKPITYPNNEHAEGKFNGGTQCKKSSKHRQHQSELLCEL